MNSLKAGNKFDYKTYELSRRMLEVAILAWILLLGSIYYSTGPGTLIILVNKSILNKDAFSSTKKIPVEDNNKNRAFDRYMSDWQQESDRRHSTLTWIGAISGFFMFCFSMILAANLFRARSKFHKINGAAILCIGLILVIYAIAMRNASLITVQGLPL